MTETERAEIWRNLPKESEFKQMTLDQFMKACREFERDFTSQATECTWSLYDAEYSAYKADCNGSVWSFMDDGDPITNEMVYCPFCGNVIKVEDHF